MTLQLDKTKAIPIQSERAHPVFGIFKGQVEIADDCCAPLTDDFGVISLGASASKAQEPSP